MWTHLEVPGAGGRQRALRLRHRSGRRRLVLRDPSRGVRPLRPEPPLPYGDGEVDVVVASSVFIHLDRDHQRTWLSELRRIISPSGLLVASIAGEYACTLGASRLRRPGQAPGSLLPRAAALRKRVALRRAGIIDRFPDAHLEASLPPTTTRWSTRPGTSSSGHGLVTSSWRRSSSAGSPVTRTSS